MLVADKVAGRLGWRDRLVPSCAGRQKDQVREAAAAEAARQSHGFAHQYADAMAGIAAMDDPTSAAARFRAYRQNTGPERDITLMDAFSQGDAHFAGDNEPQAISDWQNDMFTMTFDLNQWVEVAVSYQISEKSQADLDAAPQGNAGP